MTVVEQRVRPILQRDPATDHGTMNDRLSKLTDREKETLRLLLVGHDTKSIARHLDLSVHTINDRLREVRRKLDVASSRQAARLLAEAEQATPQKMGPDFSGLSNRLPDALSDEPASWWSNKVSRLAWFSGGMLIMSLLVVALAASLVTRDAAPPETPVQQFGLASSDPSASESQVEARSWLTLLDRGDWAESWRTAAELFKAQVTASQWAAMIGPLRHPLGRPSSRTFASVTKARTLPNVPTGDYEIIQFRTDFAGRKGVIETVTLARNGPVWRVAGYFIK